MAFNSATDLIVGGLVKVRELRELANDNAVVNFTVAVTPRKKQGNEWVDDETIWTDVVLWGRDARAFASSNIPLGTQLIVHGTRKATLRNAYTNKSGQEVPERIEQEITADFVGVAINPISTIQVSKIKTNGNGTEVPARKPASKPAPVANDVSQSDNDSIDQTDPFGEDDPFSDVDGQDDSDNEYNIF